MFIIKYEELNLIKKKYNTEIEDKALIMFDSLTTEKKTVEEFVEFLKYSTTDKSFDDIGKEFLEKNCGIKKCDDLKKIKLHFTTSYVMRKMLF